MYELTDLIDSKSIIELRFCNFNKIQVKLLEFMLLIIQVLGQGQGMGRLEIAPRKK